MFKGTLLKKLWREKKILPRGFGLRAWRGEINNDTRGQTSCVGKRRGVIHGGIEDVCMHRSVKSRKVRSPLGTRGSRN